MENVISAIITAAASIIVALLGRNKKRSIGTHSIKQKVPHHGKWIVSMLLIGGWIILSPITIHHDIPSLNVFVVLIITVIISIIWPINAWEAAAWVFGLHAVNSIAEPIARIVNRYQYAAFGGYKLGGILILTAIAFVNAFIVGVISKKQISKYFSLQKSDETGAHDNIVKDTWKEKNETTTTKPIIQDDISSQLERLVHLRDKGDITEEEFIAAKSKLLGKSD